MTSGSRSDAVATERGAVRTDGGVPETATSAWRRSRALIGPLALALVTLVVFSSVLSNDFVEWDDHVLFTGNQAYRGLGWTQVSWMFSNALMGHYVPVTWLTHGLDYVLWGMDPAGYHFTNLLLHAANAALFYFLALRLLAAATAFAPAILRLAATASALFFALHPLRAESVAWITERRDVLSGLFFFLTLLAYLRACDAGGRRRLALHAVAVGCYLLAIFSKSIVMTLPALLVLLDAYPFRRFTSEWRPWASPAARTLWREKVPYLALGLLAAMVGYFGQAVNQYFTSHDVVAWSARPSLVLYSLWFYVSKTAMPLRLSPLYELPARIDPLGWRFVGPALAVMALTLVLVLVRRRWPAGLAAWLSYAILLAPVTGAVHSGFQLAHDRYSYLSCLGWALLVGAAVGALARAARERALRPALARAAAVAALAWFAGLGLLTWQQVQTWHDTDALWRNAVEAEPECALCRYNVGARAFNSGLHALARDEFQRLLSIRPDRFQVHAQLGLAHVGLGDVRDAIVHYRKLLAQNPSDSETHNNLGVALRILGRDREALVEFRYALRLAPGSAAVRANVGVAFFEAGEREQGMLHLRRAIELKPDLPQARFALGVVLLGLGRADDAREQYRILRGLDPALAATLGGALLTGW